MPHYPNKWLNYEEIIGVEKLFSRHILRKEPFVDRLTSC